MAKRWTREEDKFLMTYWGIGPDFIASHDLGRPHGAGSRRMAKLKKSGALEFFIKIRIMEIQLDVLCGRPCYDPDFEIQQLETDLREIQEEAIK